MATYAENASAALAAKTPSYGAYASANLRTAAQASAAVGNGSSASAALAARGNYGEYASANLGTGGGLIPPFGFVFLVDNDGAYLLDSDGAYLVEAV